MRLSVSNTVGRRNYRFDTSWSAYSACKNVADAFGPAVQELLHQVVTNPQFAKLAQ